MTAPLLLTEPEAAALLQVCERTLRKARQAGQLHYVLFGRAVRYTMDDLESYIATLRQVQPPCLPQITPKPAGTPRKRRLASAEIIPFRERQRRG